MTLDAPCPNCGQLLWFPQNAVTVAQDIDETDIDILLRLAPELLPQKMLLNFQGVSFMSSAIITKLVRLNKALRDSGGKLILCNVSSTVREVFKITRLNKVFDIVDDEATGLKTFDE